MPKPPHPLQSRLTQHDLRWLVCPVCRQALTLESATGPQSPPESASAAATIRCAACNRRYPIVDGIPVLLPGRAF
ncbi:MAG: Trm112 family protein [Acidobacteriaceae bacterium]|jgi:uncharacterized protein YbaR (Trm112 family)